MPKFRKKPVIINAMQLPGPGEEATDSFVTTLHSFMRDADWYSESDGNLAIPTREGVMIASPGDWIIKGVQGEFYPCKPDIFEATYEAIPEPKAWESEDGEIIVWGTHDRTEAEKAYQRYIEEVDPNLDGDLHYNGIHYWGDPAIRTLETWPRELYGDAEQPGWEPWFVIGRSG